MTIKIWTTIDHNLKGVVYHLSREELEKWDTEHALEMSESSHTLSGRKLSIMTPSHLYQQ
uniref:Uncharacterized protein n=1 Tax=Sarcoptes scabiei TaxID=52283 RepID=A0A834RAU9_SARSC